MAVRRRPSRVKVTGHGRVSVGGLRQVSGALRAGGLSGTAGADLSRRLKEAGEFVAVIARANAGWSSLVPGSVKVRGGRSGVYIVAGGPKAPAAYPNEVAGVKHPVFGGPGTSRPKAPWVTNEHRPFLAPAGDEGADGAAEIVARVCDDWAIENGVR